eukprot:Hpha_TRINITY_DN12248_c0_g1::TRINITY_DN12248_c0_g1_i2::g.16862::m.16862
MQLAELEQLRQQVAQVEAEVEAARERVREVETVVQDRTRVKHTALERLETACQERADAARRAAEAELRLETGREQLTARLLHVEEIDKAAHYQIMQAEEKVRAVGSQRARRLAAQVASEQLRAEASEVAAADSEAMVASLQDDVKELRELRASLRERLNRPPRPVEEGSGPGTPRARSPSSPRKCDACHRYGTSYGTPPRRQVTVPSLGPRSSLSPAVREARQELTTAQRQVADLTDRLSVSLAVLSERQCRSYARKAAERVRTGSPHLRSRSEQAAAARTPTHRRTAAGGSPGGARPPVVASPVRRPLVAASPGGGIDAGSPRTRAAQAPLTTTRSAPPRPVHPRKARGR